VGSLKDFEIYGVHEKELPRSGQKSYQPDQYVHLLEVKKKGFWHNCSIVILVVVPDWP
jgi:hypothetical protein